MPTTRNPKHGSWGVWPRVRAKRHYAKIRTWAQLKEVKPLGFAGYKVGMTNCCIIDNAPNSMTKGQEISIPVTIVECPPLNAFSLVFYKKTYNGLKKIYQLFSKNPDKELKRKICLPKKHEEKQVADFDDIRLLVHTQPKIIGLKKKPDVFELAISGSSNEEKLKFANAVLGKEIKVSDVFQEGNQIDVHAVTKGKGYQGPVKRFGIGIRAHKSEKTKRGPGNVGAWTGNRSWTVSHAGQMGYHQRTQYNNWVIKISSDPKLVNRPGGRKHYGDVKSDFMIVKGSLQGPAKRILRLIHAVRHNEKIPVQAPAISFIRK